LDDVPEAVFKVNSFQTLQTSKTLKVWSFQRLAAFFCSKKR
jgi:hypothetical protein